MTETERRFFSSRHSEEERSDDVGIRLPKVDDIPLGGNAVKGKAGISEDRIATSLRPSQ